MSADRARNLFTFLKEFNSSKIKPIYQADSFKEVLWFSDLPEMSGCFSITDQNSCKGSDVDSDSLYDEWIKIQKPPKTETCPSLPSELEGIKKSIVELNNFKKEPYIEKDVFIGLTSDEKALFLNYKNDEWKPWAQKRLKYEPLEKVYKKLFDIHKTIKTQGDSYQVVLGVGLFQEEKSRRIKRHIVTTPLSIQLDEAEGSITVGPGEQGVNFTLESDSFLEPHERPKNSSRIIEDLKNIDVDFWASEEFSENILKSWINRYDSRGHYEETISHKIDNLEAPSLRLSPAIILRKRDERNFINFYKEVISHIDQSNDKTNPILSFVLEEGKSSLKEDKPLASIQNKVYLPLQSNLEQKDIVQKISDNLGVVVQGPPGTGKTHSIANLICHLLSSGKKILVTSQTDKALKVLKDKIPEEMQSLCVEILGQDQESIQDLKKSIESIDNRHQWWSESDQKFIISSLEQENHELNERLSLKEQEIKDSLKFESRNDHQFGNYSGTALEAVEQFASDAEKYKWIDNEFKISKRSSCPISSSEAIDILKFFQEVSQVEDFNYDNLTIINFDFFNSLLDAESFKKEVDKENRNKEIISKFQPLFKEEDASAYLNLSLEDKNKLSNLLNGILTKLEGLLRSEKNWVKDAAQECLKDQDRTWKHLLDETINKLEKTDDNANFLFLKDYPLEISQPFELNSKNLKQLKSRINDCLKEIRDKKEFNFGIFCSSKARALKKLLKEDTLINGKSLSEMSGLDEIWENLIVLKDWVQVNLLKIEVEDLWKDKEKIKEENCKVFYHKFKDICEPLEESMSVHENMKEVKKFIDERPSLPEIDWTLESLRKEINKIHFLDSQTENKNIEEKIEKIILSLESEKSSNCYVKFFIEYYKNRDVTSFDKMYKKVLNIKNLQNKYQFISHSKEKINSIDGKLYKTIKNDPDSNYWESKLLELEKAWDWLCFKSDFEQSSHLKQLKTLNEERKELVSSLRKNISQLSAEKSWYECFIHLTDEQKTSLKAWLHHVRKMGKGTGKSYARHKRVAQEEMSKCKTAVPAWIMPLYRVVENIKPGANLFDVAIIDEASQAGPDGFMLHYLAKKVIVIGDNEQISPDNIGLKEDRISEIRDKYLKGKVKLADSIGRGDSYYDYCHTLFSNHIQLKEHFRCMPEIIEFSNKLSYTTKPLIPMRQYGNDRLNPLETTFIDEAQTKGKSNTLVNKKEALELVRQLENCLEDPKYENKTFGIILLQTATSHKIEIEKLIAKNIDEKTCKEREIIVGTANEFQGDERDVIFISMIVSSTAEDDYKPGALSRDIYKKRFNVAASRGKDQLWLFHSIRLEELNPACFRKQLLDHFYNYQIEFGDINDQNKLLNHLNEKFEKTENKTNTNAPEPFKTWFEAEVYKEISSLGYLVEPKSKISDYEIDMVVVGSKGKLCIICEQPDRDIDKDCEFQWKMEDHGWKFFRIQSSSFSYNKKQVLKDLENVLKEMGIETYESMDLSSPNSVPERVIKFTSENKSNGYILSQEEMLKLGSEIQNTKDKTQKKAPYSFDSWFEAEVYKEIAARGYKAYSQYKERYYRIDIALFGEETKLAIECDGEYYHRGDKKKNQDRERQNYLEGLGWVFHRISYQEFSLNPKKVFEELFRKIEQMEIKPKQKENIA